MRYGVFPALNHLCFSTKSFNFFLCACAESIYLHCKFLGKVSISQNLNAISWILDNFSFFEQLYCYNGIIVKYFQYIYVNCNDILGVPVGEPALGDPPV